MKEEKLAHASGSVARTRDKLVFCLATVTEYSTKSTERKGFL